MSMPMVEPPPGRLSTSACWPRFSDNFGASRRKTTSVAPPGANGTITRTGLAGKSCAEAAWKHGTDSSATRKRCNRRLTFLSSNRVRVVSYQGTRGSTHARSPIRIRKQEPECLLWCHPRRWRHGEPSGAPPPKRSVIMEFAMTRKETDSLPFASDAERWAAVRRKDRDADGVFFYSVRTTGVYCRPSCAARLARRENVRFHASCEEAEAAGFRPCKRCRPNEAALAVRRAAAMAKACRLIETAEEMPNLASLAASAGMSRFHFHRVFKTVTGVTPKAYAAAHRARRVREALPQSSTVTEAIYGAGFNSSGPFYAESGQVLGMTPARFRSGGSGAAIRFAVGECSLGSILVAATDKGVCAILLGDKPEALVRELEDR